jgi:hypothetical protein
MWWAEVGRGSRLGAPRLSGSTAAIPNFELSLYTQPCPAELRSQPGPTDFGSRFSHSKKRDPLLQIFFFKLKHLIRISFEISQIKMIPYMVLLRIV